jgi:phosphohistidine phosphatase
LNRRLYLVRHARAEAGSPAGDAARSLTPAGAAAFDRHVRNLKDALWVSRVVASPLARARETAQILAAVTGARADAELELSPGASDARRILALAMRLGPGTALVGHNPELGDAVASVAGRKLDFPPGAIAALDLEGKDLRLAWLRVP